MHDDVRPAIPPGLYEADFAAGRLPQVAALGAHGHSFIVLYDDAAAAHAALGRMACDPELPFTWYDAALLSQRIRQAEQQRANNSPAGPVTRRRPAG